MNSSGGGRGGGIRDVIPSILFFFLSLLCVFIEELRAGLFLFSRTVWDGNEMGQINGLLSLSLFLASFHSSIDQSATFITHVQLFSFLVSNQKFFVWLLFVCVKYPVGNNSYFYDFLIFFFCFLDAAASREEF